MFLTIFSIVIIILYVLWDVNYFIRTLFTVLSGRIQSKCALDSVTSIFGFGTFQDCDITFRNIRISRLVRELDFARYHFYDRTGVYQNSIKLSVKSLQQSTFIVSCKNVPIFTRYRIDSKLIFWDDRSLFFLHEVVTIHDDLIRAVLVSRQFAVGDSIEELLRGLTGSDIKHDCPEIIRHWLQYMKISSDSLRIDLKVK